MLNLFLITFFQEVFNISGGTELSQVVPMGIQRLWPHCGDSFRELLMVE